MNEVSIITYPRIHVTLIGMNHLNLRKHGGIGFSISNPCLNIICKEAKEFEINDRRKIKLSVKEYERLLNILNKFSLKNNFKKKMIITIDGEIIPHYGFGSETALRLASLESLTIINDYTTNTKELMQASGRGGVSGIGINAYFNGGLIFDAGTKENVDFKPSNRLENRESLPLMIKRVDTENWELGLYLNTKIMALDEKKETEFFQSACPISDADVYEILYVSVYGCLSSAIEKEKNNFCNSINKLQITRWKYLERSLYNGLIERDEDILLNCGASAVGMSSLGPLLYFFSEIPIVEVIEKAKRLGLKGRFYKTIMNNRGRQINYE